MKLAEIRIDGGTQPRAALDQAAVDEYAEVIDRLPPGKGMFDGTAIWLYDGHHTFFAHKKAGRDEMAVDVTPGTQRDAILASLSANAEHGLRRTNDDKRKAVRVLLADPEWVMWSDRNIASHCRVSYELVAAMRDTVQIAAASDGSAPPDPSLATAVVERVREIQSAGGTARVVERRDGRSGKRSTYAARVSKSRKARPTGDVTPADPNAPPWESFNAVVREIAGDVRALSRRLAAVFEVDPETKKIRCRYAHFYGYTGTVGFLNQFARELEAGLPYRKADGKPGFVNKLTADQEDKKAA
jgi:hypothetical protein